MEGRRRVMLYKVKTLTGYKLDGVDGEMGKVKEFYFDDLHWTIRYLVAETGNWLMDRKVLISPYALGAVNQEKQTIAIGLTKMQIEKSPSLAKDRPVSRQFEENYHGYYGWPMYWAGPYAWGPYPNIVRTPGQWKGSGNTEKAWDPHLRSTREVGGYHAHASDGEIGHVEDFIVDDETWAIRYLVVDTRNWLHGKQVLISPRWIEKVSWGESKVFVNLSRESVEKSPEYSETSLPNRDYEATLHRHYDREGYWDGELVSKRHHQ
jgi:PRC-barrel domain